MLNARAKSLKQWFCTFQRLRIAAHQEHQLRALCLRSAAGYHRIQQRDADLARDAAKFMDPCRGECGTFYRDGSGLRTRKSAIRSIQQTCREASSLLTMAMIKSLPSAASLGVAAAFAPDPASLLAASGVRFQTVSSCPALSRFAAIREPIAPSPRNATLLMLDSSRRPNGRRLKASFSFRSLQRTWCTVSHIMVTSPQVSGCFSRRERSAHI